MQPAPSPDKAKDSGKPSGQDKSGDIQKAFDAYAKLDGSKDGKLKSDSIQKWIKKAGIPGVSDEDIKKHFGKDGGLDFNEFKQGIEKLAKEKKLEKDDIMKKLSSALPSGGGAMGGAPGKKDDDPKKKDDDPKAKLGGEKK